MTNKVTEIKTEYKGKKPTYWIISHGNANPVAQTHSIESARMIRDTLEDLYREWWAIAVGGEPLTERYEIRVNQKGASMPNHWMDQIITLYNKYYNNEIDRMKLINKVEQVMVDYREEFKKYDEAVTAEMNEREQYGQS